MSENIKIVSATEEQRMKGMINHAKEKYIKNKKLREGEIGFNKHKRKMTIINYIASDNVVVEFDNGYITKANYSDFKKGTVFNPYDMSVFGVGFLGEGIYCDQNKISKIGKIQHNIWRDMLRRCYLKTHPEKRPTYQDCTVCNEWHNFQVFAKWYDENYYEVNDEVMCIDKDILYKGNKIYSPKTCIFAPEKVNILFTKSDAIRGECPIGVYYRKDTGKYVAQCNNGGKVQVFLGSHSTSKRAFCAYREYKENLIKEIADKYKDQIPQKLYDALYTYKVEITD